MDWRNDAVEATYAHLERFYNLAREILADSSIDESAEKALIDRWMLSRLQRRVAEATEAMEKIQTRRALQSAFYLLFNDCAGTSGAEAATSFARSGLPGCA